MTRIPPRAQLNAEVDEDFFSQHPQAPRPLDPHNPAHASLVANWNEIFRLHLNGWVDHIFRQFFPNSPDRLDPHNPDHATLVEYWTDLRDMIRDGAYPKYDWTASPGMAHPAGPADGSGGNGSGGVGHHDPAAPGGGAKPPTPDVRLDESAFLHYMNEALHGTHVIGDSAEVLGLLAQAFGANEHAAIVALGEWLGYFGYGAATLVVIWETVRAFGTGERLQEQQGLCYGLMWQVCGLPDAEKGFVDHGWDSAEELREAFHDGVSAGRARAADPVLHNKVMLCIAYYQLHGDDLTAAQAHVLNDLWLNIRESDKARDYLLWPAPESMQQ